MKCEDKKCPVHGEISTRGRSFIGKVVRVNVHKTATVEWDRLVYINKYERYEKRRSRIQVHKPDCMNISVGDVVEARECRALSKLKNFVIIRKVK